MPIYEYECHACGHTLDALQKISDGVLRKCPECSKLKLKRLISAPKFRLKGEGWYETDFKKDNQRNLAGDKSEKDSKKSKADDKSSDSKKATASDKPAKTTTKAKAKTGAN